MEQNFRCRMPQKDQEDRLFPDFEQARRFADENFFLGCTVTDADGRTELMHEETGVAIVPVTFKIKMDEHYIMLLDILMQETGRVFSQVLEDAGVYKRTKEGQDAFDRFVASI